MRRGINIRKKKKIILNKINQKSLKLLTIFFTTLIVCIVIYVFFLQDIFINATLKENGMNFSSLNADVPFTIGKILLFNSATAESNSVNNLLSLDISEYCDICIYLNKTKNEDILISSLYIDNISISNPELGTPYLYKKIISDFGKCSFSEDKIINDRFDFNIVNTEKAIDYSNFEISNDFNTPISLGFYNKNIKTNFISDNTEILYNGTLLKNAVIPLTSLQCSISFTINIITNSNEHYICNVNLDIPFSNNEISIYDVGYITKEIPTSETNKFIRIK